MRRVAHLLVALIAIACVLPLSLMVLASLKSSEEIAWGNIFALPHHATLAAWAAAWSRACIGGVCQGIRSGLVNSIRIDVAATFLSVLLGATTALALTLQRSRRRKMLYCALLLQLFIPTQVILIPLIVLIRELGLFGKIGGVILAHTLVGLPVVTVLFSSVFSSVSREIVAAARLDGAGFFRLLWNIMVPTQLPMCLIAVALQFTFIWNDFILGLTFAGRTSQPATVVLNVLASPQFGTPDYNVNMAAALIAAAPTMLVFLAVGWGLRAERERNGSAGESA